MSKIMHGFYSEKMEQRAGSTVWLGADEEEKIVTLVSDSMEHKTLWREAANHY